VAKTESDAMLDPAAAPVPCPGVHRTRGGTRAAIGWAHASVRADGPTARAGTNRRRRSQRHGLQHAGARDECLTIHDWRQAPLRVPGVDTSRRLPTDGCVPRTVAVRCGTPSRRVRAVLTAARSSRGRRVPVAAGRSRTGRGTASLPDRPVPSQHGFGGRGIWRVARSARAGVAASLLAPETIG
jgi:hypothetical protein